MIADTTCPSCDGDLYDETAGYCEECGFEGFDGDQKNPETLNCSDDDTIIATERTPLDLT